MLDPGGFTSAIFMHRCWARLRRVPSQSHDARHAGKMCSRRVHKPTCIPRCASRCAVGLQRMGSAGRVCFCVSIARTSSGPQVVALLPSCGPAWRVGHYSAQQSPGRACGLVLVLEGGRPAGQAWACEKGRANDDFAAAATFLHHTSMMLMLLMVVEAQR